VVTAQIVGVVHNAEWKTSLNGAPSSVDGIKHAAGVLFNTKAPEMLTLLITTLAALMVNSLLTTNSHQDVGMWQINSMNWNMCSSGKAPCDPQVNLKCAITIWNYHKSFKLWSTCRACGCC
jgi:hypothetical protein